LRWKRILIVYEKEDLKEHRRVVHLGILWKETEEEGKKEQTENENPTKWKANNSVAQFWLFWDI
jgi:phosphoribosylaminoimidazole carboxylase (NCAIR synthetase)